MAQTPATVMEMRMILSMVTRSIQSIESAQEGLAIQHRDLTRQSEWIRDAIRDAAAPTIKESLTVAERVEPSDGEWGNAARMAADNIPTWQFLRNGSAIAYRLAAERAGK